MKTFLIAAVLLLAPMAFANTNSDVPSVRSSVVLRLPIFETEEDLAKANEQLAWSSGNQQFCTSAQLQNCLLKCKDTTAYIAGGFAGRGELVTNNDCSKFCFINSGCRHSTD